MTTIAYRNGVMAGDTRISNESDIDVSAFRKVYKLRSGALIGFAGNVGDIQKTIDALHVNPNNLGFTPEDDEFEALLVLPDGKVRHWQDATWFDIDAKFFAIGSGGDAANVAMHTMMVLGAEIDPRKAIRVAMKFDKGTGGKVHTVRLGKTGRKRTEMK